MSYQAISVNLNGQWFYGIRDPSSNRNWISLGLLCEIEQRLGYPIGCFRELNEIMQEPNGTNHIIMGYIRAVNMYKCEMEEFYVLDNENQILIIK